MTNYAPISDYFTTTSTPSHLHYPLPSPMIYSLDLIGLFGPIILALFSLWQLWNNGIYWYVYIIYLNNIYHIMLYNQTKFPISPDYTPVHMSWHLMIGGWRLSPAGNPFRCMCCARTHILPNQIQGKNHTQ